MAMLQRKGEKKQETNAAPVATMPTTAVVKPPSGFGALAPMGQISAPATDKVPWLVFYSDRMQAATAITKALGSMRAGAALLKLPGDEGYARVNTIHLVTARQFYTATEWSPSEGYKTVRASLVQDAEKTLETDILAVALCYTDDGIVPAVAQFRKSHAVAAQRLAAEVYAANGNWAAVVGDLTYETRQSKAKFPYVIVSAEVRSVSAEEATLLKAYSEDDDAQKLSAKVVDAFNNKVRALESMCPKTP